MHIPNKFTSSLFPYLLILFLMNLSVNSFAFDPDKKIDLPLLVKTFEQDQNVLNRYYNIRNSPEYFQRFENFYNEYLNQLDIIDFDQLSNDALGFGFCGNPGRSYWYVILAVSPLCPYHFLPELPPW